MGSRVSTRQAWLALAAMIPAVLVVGLDVTVLSVALPTLATSLSATTEQLQWIVMTYTITYAAGIIPFGLLGDRFGRRCVLVISLVVFASGSLWCALAGSAASLIGARALLGVGAAGIATLSTAIVNVLFDESRRERAITLIVLVNVVGFPLGPILGGWMLGHFAWGWIFLINVPIVVVSLATVLWKMPENRASAVPRWDVPGIATATAAIVLLCYGFTEAGSTDWNSPAVWGTLLGGLAAVVAFVVIERRAASPAVPLALFSRPRFAFGAAAATVLSFTVAGLLFVVPQYTSAILGADTLTSGLYLLPFAVGMAITMPVLETLTRTLGPIGTIGLGLATLSVGMVIALATVHSGHGRWLVAWATIVGAAFGLGLSTAMDLAIGAVDVEASGAGSAVLQSLRQVGTAIGIAVLGSLLVSGYRSGLPTDLPIEVSQAVRGSAEEGLAVARQLGSTPLIRQIQAAFVQGAAGVWLACLLVAAVAALAALGAAVQRGHRAWRAPR